MSVYLPLSTQENIFLYFNIIFIISTSLNVIGLFFLVKQTPPNQSTIRNYLILIQVLLLVSDIHLDIGFHPIPLFPVLAGYAVGILIQFGLSTHLELAITITVYVWIGMTIVICILFRHQTFFREGNKFKLSPATFHTIQCLVVLVPSIAPLIYACNGKNAETVDRLLIEDPHNITWIRDRGSYYMEKRTSTTVAGMIFVIFDILFGSVVVVSLFAHMFYVLRQDENLTCSQAAMYSEQSMKAIKRSLIALFLQLVIPLGLFAVPTVTIFVSLATETLLSFEVTLYMFLILPCHSVGHNLILLTVTPAYRKVIVAVARGIITCRWNLPKESKTGQTTVVI